MRYYSEQLKKFYDTEKDCVAAEKEYAVAKAKEDEELKKKADEKKARAAEVEDAYSKYREAQKEVDNLYKNYLELRKKFVADYNYFHQSYRDEDGSVVTISDIFNTFFKF